jgi:hypothetical protein
MDKNQGKAQVATIIIVLLSAILLTVTNPKMENHVAAINNRLGEEGAITNVLTRGLLAVKPPAYHNLVLLSYTKWNNKITSIGVFGYVWVNKTAFK